MYLQSISIEWFKGFYEKQELNLAIPDGKPASGLTVLVGSDNSGKSTVFDAILKLGENKRFLREERHDGEKCRIVLRGTDGKSTEIENVPPGATVNSTGPFRATNFEYISARRHWNHRFGSMSDIDVYANARLNSGRSNDVDQELGGLLAIIDKDPARKQRLSNLIRSLLPTFNEWFIDADENGFYVGYKTNGRAYHKAGFFGDGVISLFRLGAHLSEKTSRILLLALLRRNSVDRKLDHFDRL